jgi:hypothetical protein
MGAITQEKQIEEYIKCFEDKTRIYFIENYFKTYDASRGIDVAFKLFPKQKEFLVNIAENTSNIILKPRQSGYSTVTCACIAANLVFAGLDNHEIILLIANKLDMSKDDLSKLKEFLLQVPRWFWGEEYYHPNENALNDNGKKINDRKENSIFKKETQIELELFTGSKIYARSSGKNASRGISACSWLFFDEAAFIENGSDVAASAIRTTGTVKNKHIIMVSTPNLKDSLYYPTYHNAQLGLNNYKVTYLKWYYDPRFNKNLKWYKENIAVDKNGEETKDILWEEEETIDKEGNVAYNPERWKKMEGDGWKATSPWFVTECNNSNNDQIKIAQELLCSFIGSGNVAVDPKITEMQQNKNVTEDYKTDPLYEDIRIFKPPVSNHRYILAADVSRGDASDNAAFEILDIDAVDELGYKHIEQVVEFEGKVTGDILGELCFKYGTIYNTAFIIVDCIGGYGESTVLTLLNLKYPNLYYEDIQNKDYMINSQNLETFTKDDKLPGFHAKSARTYMISTFIQALTNNLLRIRSIRVIGELETWVVKTNGKIEHLSGCHDDTLMCLAMAMFAYEHNFIKIELLKETDKEILKSFMSSLHVKPQENNSINDIGVHPNFKKMTEYNIYRIYRGNQFNKQTGPYDWLFNKR